MLAANQQIHTPTNFETKFGNMGRSGYSSRIF